MLHPWKQISNMPNSVAGWSSLAARRAHNPKVVGSNPAPATKIKKERPTEAFFLLFKTTVEANMRKNEAIEEILRPAVEALGYELVGVEYHPNSVNALLRVFIDKEGGVNLDDCVAVNEQVGALLDVNDPIQGKYTLEISSPGLDRPLFKIEDFVKFIGADVKIRLTQPIERQRNFKGSIHAVDGDTVKLVTENDTLVEIDFNKIDVARIIPTFD